MSNTIRVLGISGSLRAKSCNTGLLRAAAGQLPEGMELHFANLIEGITKQTIQKPLKSNVHSALRKVELFDASCF